MKPVSETPTEPTDYAAISLVFGSLLAGLAASARSRDPIPPADLVPLSAATFSLSRLLVHDKAESWLRQPFVAEEAGEKRPKGRRLRYAVGELMTCTRCMGAWSALGLVGLRLHAPRAGRTVTAVLAASAGNDALQAGVTWLWHGPTSRRRRPRGSRRRSAAPSRGAPLDGSSTAGGKRVRRRPRRGSSIAAMRAHAFTPTLRTDQAVFGATPSPVRLSLPAHPRSIALVRRALEAIAEELALPRRLIEDMRLAVTEACTNVVRHAYAGDDADDASAIRVALLPEEHGMRVIVEDGGRGLGPSPDARGPGLGLPLIAALTSQLEVSHGADDRGSRIAMSFTPGPIEAA